MAFAQPRLPGCERTAANNVPLLSHPYVTRGRAVFGGSQSTDWSAVNAASCGAPPVPCIRGISQHQCGALRWQRHQCQVSSAVDSAEIAFKAAKPPAFPFVRLADQEDMKLALLLNVIDPAVGGVLILGDRGTGKSVAVRCPSRCSRWHFPLMLPPVFCP